MLGGLPPAAQAPRRVEPDVNRTVVDWYFPHGLSTNAALPFTIFGQNWILRIWRPKQQSGSEVEENEFDFNVERHPPIIVTQQVEFDYYARGTVDDLDDCSGSWCTDCWTVEGPQPQDGISWIIHSASVRQISIAFVDPYEKLRARPFLAPLAAAFDNPALSDARLLIGDTVIHVSRAVLSRSKFFETLFLGSFSESCATDPIPVLDVDPEPARSCIRWMYDGFLDIGEPSTRAVVLIKAHKVAKRFLIEDLTAAIREILKAEEITPTNFGQFFKFASEENMDEFHARIASTWRKHRDECYASASMIEFFDALTPSNLAAFIDRCVGYYGKKI